MINRHISIVVWGHIHRDPNAFRSLNEFIQQAHEQKIPLVICEEDHAEQTLEGRLVGNKQIVSINTKLLEMPFIKALLKKDKPLPYFTLADLSKLENSIEKNLPSLTKGAINEMAWNLLRDQAFKESIKLTEALIKLKIPYLGIEFSRKQREEMIRLIGQNNLAYLAFEQARIEKMKDNILQKALPHFKKKGIIIVLAGVNHSHRLAVNLWQACAKQTNDHFKIFPLKLFSSYVLDGIPSHKDAEAKSQLNDPSSILQGYKLLPAHEIILQDDSKPLSTISKNILDYASTQKIKSNTRWIGFDFFTTKDLVTLSLVSKHYANITKTELAERYPSRNLASIQRFKQA